MSESDEISSFKSESDTHKREIVRKKSRGEVKAEEIVREFREGRYGKDRG